MKSNKILCVFPDDMTTRFLNKIQIYLNNNFREIFHCFKIKPNDDSHSKCLERISSNADEELIIFLGHGRSDRLFGSKTDYSYSLFPSQEFESLFPEAFYSNDNFINKDNISIFKNKKIFCLSCNSADGLGAMSIANGAKVFIGFGNIPTESDDEGIGNLSPILTARFKGELNKIVKLSLAYAIKNNKTFYELIDIINLYADKSINEIVLLHKALRQRRNLSDVLYQFKDEIKLFGDGNLKLLG